MPAPALTLVRFRPTRPRYELPQARLLDWLAAAHAEAQARLEGAPPEARGPLAERVRKVLGRCGCPPDKIAARGFMLPDCLTTRWDDNDFFDVARRPRGPGSEERSRRFDALASAYFEAEYAGEAAAPRDLIHVTCTGYVAPSAAQRLVAARGWGGRTRVTHAYHMGCYASIPALRLAAGCFATATPAAPAGAGRVDVVHTELCSLHFDPSAQSVEQLVVQSLFADGMIRYSVEPGGRGPGLALLATHERVLPDSAGDMAWIVGDHGMRMTLSPAVPARVAGSLRGFVAELLALGGRGLGELPGAVWAVHPGGPKIIDGVRAALELDEAQVRASREVLRAYGNMSSATLPHVWARVLDDPAVRPGTLVVGLAFGPGLTVCGCLLEKR
ncbi:MAG TPA: 3-oxoacyl-[acyl-carrier-protein] synthase III C-terminal domain-containing protein [Polyangiaceae bacterium]|nr:3-oxoacyl-[acyl-carrier-protein] synthase III C-terminal domain-containing protein [Polyangiaceae bacterium]